MFLGPLTTFLLMMICMASISVMTRAGTIRHVNTKIGLTWPRWGFGRNPRDHPVIFEGGRLESLLRCDQLQKKSQERIGRLRTAKAKIDFDVLPGKRALSRR